jgi:LacI family transcriptional regulator
MRSKLTQRDLAKLAGVSAMTISLALRNHPSISRETKQRVQELARQHRYRPDPALAALNAYRVNRAAPRFHGTLAWLTAFSTANAWRGMVQAEGYFIGARRRAEKLGYQIEDVWAAEPGLTAPRLTQILASRGIRGLIVAPLPQAHGEIKLDWAQFSSVALGYSLVRPQLHVVMNHQFRNMKHLVHELAGLGYRRIGLALPSVKDERVDHNYLSGYWIAQQGLPAEAKRLPPLLAEVFDQPTFLSWYRKQLPDAVIVSASDATTVIAWLEQAGVAVPRHVGVAVASVPYGDRRISGIDENVEAVGAMAVDTIVGMIYRNETGIPALPWRILSEGTWRLGRTVRRQRVAG